MECRGNTEGDHDSAGSHRGVTPKKASELSDLNDNVCSVHESEFGHSLEGTAYDSGVLWDG